MRNITTILATTLGMGLLSPTPIYADTPQTQAGNVQPSTPSVSHDFEAALKHMREQLQNQADQGDPEAQLKLGMVYERGMGGAVDPKKAQDLFKLAFKPLEDRANQGDPVDQLLVGMMYEKGMGVEKDANKAQSLYEKSSVPLQSVADQGDTRALRTLGWKYEEGLGVARDIPKAQEYYKKAVTIDQETATKAHEVPQK